MSVDLSNERLDRLRKILWLCNSDEQDICLEQMAGIIELMIAGKQTRWQIAELLRELGYGHSELGMLRRWALRRKHWELDEVIAAIGAEIRGKRQSVRR